MSKLTITISGPAGSGKTVLAKFLAKFLFDAQQNVTLTDDQESKKVDITALEGTHVLWIPIKKLNAEINIVTKET